MMDATVQHLTGAGVPIENVYTEAFGSPPPAGAQTTDDPASVEAGGGADAGVAVAVATGVLTFSQSGQSVQVASGETVLDAAEAAGLDLPWECRSGVCGQCKLKCSSGSVRHEFSDALSAKDLSEGQILACQATLTSEEVIVEA